MAAITASTDAVTLGSANKRGRALYYDDTAIFYVLLGSGTPSPTNFTVKLGAGLLSYWEAPFGYSGPIRGVWSAATGAAQLTEFD